MVDKSIDPVLGISQVELAVGLDRSTISRKVADGTFPPASYTVSGQRKWRRSVIDRWMEEKVDLPTRGVRQLLAGKAKKRAEREAVEAEKAAAASQQSGKPTPPLPPTPPAPQSGGPRT